MAEFASANVANLSVQVNVDSDANIATSGAAVGTKKISMKGFKANGTLANANTVFNALLTDICGGTYDSLTANKTINQGVEEGE